MFALYRCGRQADALAAYRAGRSLLVDELGLEPGPALRRLHQQILAQDPALDVAETWQPPLPVPETPLVGRDAELDEVRALLAGGVRLLTVTGPGGIGKTRFVLELAASVPALCDGVFVVALSAVGSPGDVGPAIAEAVGAPIEGDGLQRRLAGRETLLVLDGFEAVLPAAPLVARLLDACPELCVLATSRVPLRLAGERELELGRLRDSDALVLLEERIQAVRRELDAEDAVGEIGRRLEGVPLAIELAASRLRHFPADVLLSRLDRALAPVPGLAGPSACRRTLRTTIEWSYRLLDPDAQRLLDCLSVFAGGWTVEQAERVCPGDERGAAADGLALLADARLVELGEARYDMHDAVREFAAERLEERGERARARAAQRDCLLELVESIRPIVTLGRGPLGPERENLRAALRFSLDAGDHEQALLLAQRLWRYWAESGAVSEARHWLDAALDAAPRTGSALEGRCLDAAAFLASLQGETSRATELSEAAVALLGSLPEAGRAYAWALFRRGLVDVAAGRLEPAGAWLEQAVARFVEEGFPDGEAWTLIELHRRSLLAGEVAAAVAGLEEARRVARRAAELAVQPFAQTLYGSALALAGEPGPALPHIETGLEQLLALGAGFTLATALVHAAPAFAAAGDAAAERRAAARALEICRDALSSPTPCPPSRQPLARSRAEATFRRRRGSGERPTPPVPRPVSRSRRSGPGCAGPRSRPSPPRSAPRWGANGPTAPHFPSNARSRSDSPASRTRPTSRRSRVSGALPPSPTLSRRPDRPVRER